MKKSVLEKFIKKYNINGTIEVVKFVVVSADKHLKTAAMSDDKHVMVDITLSEFSELSDLEFGIYDTKTMKKMLSAVTEDITLTTNTDNGRIASVCFNDGNVEVQCATADLRILPKTPKIKQLPPFTVEIDMTREFMDKYIKAKTALSDEHELTIMLNKKNKVEMVIGHGKNNTNRITLKPETKAGKDVLTKPVRFNANYLKEVLIANSECDSTTMSVSDEGLISISFNQDNFNSLYYLRSLDL